MVEQQSVIREDVFSYTRAGTPWMYPGPWVQVVMYWLFQAGGVVSLNAAVSLLVLLTWGVVWYQAKGLPGVKALLVVLGAASALFYYVARPFLISFLLFALFLLLFRRQEQGSNHWAFWLVVPLMTLWVNSHGGFIAGFLVWGVYFFAALLTWLVSCRKKENIPASAADLRKSVSAGLLMGAASLLNPLGLGIWQLFFSTIARQAEKQHILEWKSPDFHSPLMMPFLILIAVTFLVVGLSRKMKLTETLLLGGFLFLGLVSIRNVYFFAITAVVVLTPYASELVQVGLSAVGWGRMTGVTGEADAPVSFGYRVIYTVLGVVALVLMVQWAVMQSSAERQAAQLASAFPVDAVAYLKEADLPPRVFNTYNFGGFLTWSLPAYPVFIDGRADLYQDELFFEWYQVVEGDSGWQETLEKWDVGFLMLEPFRPLVKHLICYGWEQTYADDLVIIFVRSDKPQACAGE